MKIKRSRTKPNVRLIRSPRGKIQKLFINNRIERVTLAHEIVPESCIFLPILNQIVVISSAEPGARCYAKPLYGRGSGYKILTFSDAEVTEDELLATLNAIKGLTFHECALNCADVRERYLAMLTKRNLCNAIDESQWTPKLFVRYGDRLNALKRGQRTSSDVLHRKRSTDKIRKSI